MPNRELATVPARRFLCKEDLVPGPASEPTGSLCKIAWLGKSHLEREEQWRQLRNDKFRALKDARRSRSSEEPALRAEVETGTITHSCASVWRAEFADLEIALRGNRTRSGAKSERVTGANLRRHLALGFASSIFTATTRRDRIELDCLLSLRLAP
jgi:hypothetical protein